MEEGGEAEENDRRGEHPGPAEGERRRGRRLPLGHLRRGGGRGLGRRGCGRIAAADARVPGVPPTEARRGRRLRRLLLRRGVRGAGAGARGGERTAVGGRVGLVGAGGGGEGGPGGEGPGGGG